MAYNQPGVRVRQEVVESTLTTVESELPTCVIGPFFQVINDGVCGVLDPLSPTDPLLPWLLPNGDAIPVGSVVDLSGVKSQRIDSQRKILYDIVASFQVVDTTTGLKYPVDDSNVYEISQSGFKLDVDQVRVTRATVSGVFVTQVNNQIQLYAPGGGFLSVKSLDRFELGGNSMTVNSVVDDRKVTYSGTDPSPDQSVLLPATVTENAAGAVSVFKAETIGGKTRITSTTPAVADFTGVSVGDVAVTGLEIVGFTNINQTANTVELDGDWTGTAGQTTLTAAAGNALTLKVGDLITVAGDVTNYTVAAVTDNNNIEVSPVLVTSPAVQKVTHDKTTRLVEIGNNSNAAGASVLFNGVAVPADKGLVRYANFTGSATLSEFDDYWMKIFNKDKQDAGASVQETYFVKIDQIDVDAQEVLFDINTLNGTTLNEANGDAAVFDEVSVTIYRSQLGHVTAVDSTTPPTFIDVDPDVQNISQMNTWVEVYPGQKPFGAPAEDNFTNVPFYAPSQVEATYRVLRRDLVGSAFSAETAPDIAAAVGGSYPESADYRDGLGWAVQLATLAQPNQRPVYFVPVDPFADDLSPSGLPEDQDMTLAYINGFEKAESLDVYNIVPLHNSSAIDSALKQHVTTMSSVTEGMERRGFFVVDIPMGAVPAAGGSSNTGEISPGFVQGGIVTADLTGNAVIKDPNVNFVQEGVTPGTKVIVTFPPALAGTYLSTADTSDTELHLSLGASSTWSLVKEFPQTADITLSSAGDHTLTTVNPQWQHVDVGDFVEVTATNNTDSVVSTFRLKVINVSSDFKTLTLVDNVPGIVDFGGGQAPVGTTSVIRSWGYDNGGTLVGPNVEYYISPLQKSEQVSTLASLQTFQDRRFTALIAQSPNMDIGNNQTALLSPNLTAVAVAAKRSGLQSNDEVTNLTLGGGINSVTYAQGYFSRSQLNSLAEAGYTLLAQESSLSEPYIRDMITTKTGAGLVNSEEIVTSNADWQAKTLRKTFVSKPGSKPKLLTPRLIGIRTMQIDAILHTWRNEDPPRLLDYSLTKVAQNATNKRQLDIQFTAVFPLAEKEIEFVMELSVGE